MLRSSRRLMSFFQSTRPLRGETQVGHHDFQKRAFSIHSPLAGRDQHGLLVLLVDGIFNPLAPCGARLVVHLLFTPPAVFSIHSPLAGQDPMGQAVEIFGVHFQSTRPLRGETCLALAVFHFGFFSIHSPLAGRDLPCSQLLPRHLHFQSTRPLRGETAHAYSSALQS